MIDDVNFSLLYRLIPLISIEMPERTACLKDHVAVQHTSRSIFSKTNQASLCRGHAPDLSPNTHLNPNFNPRCEDI